MHYVIGDIHNDNFKFEAILKRLSIKDEDHVYLLGDLFDRCETRPDPVGVYFNVLKLGAQVTVIAGNHDLWLSQYIDEYLAVPERKRFKLKPNLYNTFSIMRERLTDVDLKNVSEHIKTFPLQIEVDVEGQKYLLAHAQTSSPDDVSDISYYVMGNGDESFFEKGIEGYTSICGHTDSSFMIKYQGEFSVPGEQSIWRNEKKNLVMMDCGCGFESGLLACLCLETEEEFYV